MEPVTWGFIGTITGTIAGASASIVTTLITQNNVRRIKKEESLFVREQSNREFQFNNLLKVQDALYSGIRLVARAHLQDMENHNRDSASSTMSLLSDELDNEILLSNKELSILSERIANKDLRHNIKSLREKMTSVLMARTAKESKKRMTSVSLLFDESMAEVGKVLRETL